MTWRTIWTPPGHFAPRWHDFRYEQAARHLEGIVSELGASAEVVELGNDEQGRDAGSEPHRAPETGERVRTGTDAPTGTKSPQNGAERIFVSRVVATEGEA